jgi:hypothetical protein
MMDVLGRAEAHARTHLQQRVHVIMLCSSSAVATSNGHPGPSFLLLIIISLSALNGLLQAAAQSLPNI